MILPSPIRVFVRDLCLFGHHGVLPEENRLGQRFIVEIEIHADLACAVQDDDYDKAVCYGTLCEIAREVVAGPPLKLIETVADRIARCILERCPRVDYAAVCVRKPSAPLPYAVSEAATRVEHRRAHAVAFSLGANLGEREATLRAALNALALHEGIEIERVSSLYDSAPWGREDQPAFVNLCALGRTVLPPHALLAACKTIERDLGRLPGVRWGERAVDIDLLYYGQRVFSDAVLTVPHPSLFDRAFVLEPLAEIAPGCEIAGRKLSEALARLPRSAGDAVRRGAENKGA